jgi:hypothetical protein
MFFLALSLLSLMLVFVNSLYYTLRLLALVVVLLLALVLVLNISVLTIIMLCTVYLGAIIILIGYICAICPNIVTSPAMSSYSLLFISCVFLTLYFVGFTCPLNSPLSLSMVEFFYSAQGLSVFLVVLTMLFITLLMVTCQYLTPKGPFRSVSL